MNSDLTFQEDKEAGTKPGGGGDDLMAALTAKLVLRRKAISGTQARPSLFQTFACLTAAGSLTHYSTVNQAHFLL
jgi:hypothetical protein